MFRSLKSDCMLKINKKGRNYGTCVVATSRIPANYAIYHATDFLVFSTPTYQTVQVSEHTHVLDIVFAHMNHSCSPTTFIDSSSLTVFAKRDIEVGEELTFFYPANEWQMNRPFRCMCGAANCTGTVSGARDMSADLLQRYQLNGHIARMFNIHCAAEGKSQRLSQEHTLIHAGA